MALVSGWKDEQRITLLQQSHSLCAPCGSLMLTAEAGYGLEATIRSRQIDVEGVVGLLDNLKAWRGHNEHNSTNRTVGARNAWRDR
jgi:hypothetical protein